MNVSSKMAKSRQGPGRNQSPASKRAGSALELARRFAANWDTDGDGRVTNDEFMERVSDPRVQSVEAMTLASVVRFQRAQAKHWSGPFPALSLATLGNSAKSKFLRADLERRQAFSKDRLVRSANQLFPSGGRVHADSMKQFIPPQCTFHAALFALAAGQPDKVCALIKASTDGGYEVNFPGLKSPLRVEPPTDTERILLSNALDDGLWLTVLEKAWGQRTGLGIGGVLQTPGTATEAIGALSGLSVREIRLSDSSSDIQERLQSVREALELGDPVVAQTDDTDRPGLTAWHAYSLIDWDVEAGTVLLRDPVLKAEPTSADGTPLDGVSDGYFKMDLEQLAKDFASLFLPDRSPDVKPESASSSAKEYR